MTAPSALTRKLIDVPKIFAVLDAEKHLVHGSLVAVIGDSFGASFDAYVELSKSQTPPEPGPLAVANCEHVGRCAMGALLYATGRLTFKHLNDLDGDSESWDLSTMKALYDAYGLQRYHAGKIIGANDEVLGDDVESIATRRQRVKARILLLQTRQTYDLATDLEDCRLVEAEYTTQECEHFAALDLGEPVCRD